MGLHKRGGRDFGSLYRSDSQLHAVEYQAEANPMGKIGNKLLIIRNRRGLSLRQVERLTTIIANRHGDKARQVSASWLGRIERENHSIAHKKLESLEEVYNIPHEELIETPTPENEPATSPHFHFPDVPAAVLKGLTSAEAPLLPPESWLAYFPDTTLLPPPLSSTDPNYSRTARKGFRGAEPLYGILGTNDTTLMPFVQPGSVVEINPSIRTIDPKKILHSIFERPIYFLRTHDRYYCSWCELDAEKNWLTLVPSAMAATPHRRWRYRQEVEVVGMVNRVLTRLGFSKRLGVDYVSPDEHSNST
jgi:transcriptional regulator with XRE-family HTH domain